MTTAAPPLPIRLELGPQLEGLAARMLDPGRTALESRLQDAVDELGWPASVRFDVTTSESSRAARVAVRDRIIPYSPELMSRVRRLVVPDHPDDDVVGDPDGNRFPDGWLADRWRNARTSPDGDPEHVRGFLERLVLEVVRANPEALIDPAGAERYALLAGCADVGQDLGPERLAAVLHDLVELGLSLRRGAQLLTAIGAGNGDGLTPGEIVESVFDRVRPAVIELHAPPDAVATPASPEPALSALSAAVFDRFGLNLPRVVLRPVRRPGPAAVAVRVNDRTGIPVRCPAAGDGCLELGFRLLEEEIVSRPGWLLGMRDVEYLLSSLTETSAGLVGFVLSWLPLEELTRVLRAMLAEQVPIRDLRGILERLLELPQASTTEQRVCHVRLGVVAQRWPEWDLDPDGLRVVEMPEPAPEQLLDEAVREAARDAAFAAGLGATHSLPVVVSGSARAEFRRILAPELPLLPVLGREEIPAHISLRRDP